MPDGDVIFRRLVPCWRRPYNLIKGGAADPALVGSAVVKAVARNLRLAGGAPGLYEVAGVVEEAARGKKTVPVRLRELRTVERANRGHVNTRVLAHVGGQLVAEIQHNGQPPSDAARAVAERFCEQLVSHNLFSRVLPALVGKRFAGHREAAAFERQVIGAARQALQKEAVALLHNPSAVGLRAPSIAGTRRPTVETLHEPIAL